MAEDATWFRLDESESCFLVQMSGSYRDIVCSQSDLAITYLSSEHNSFFDQQSADPKPTSPSVDQQ